jgi:hypothetical protein
MASKDIRDPGDDAKLLRRVLIGVLAAATIFIAIFSVRAVASFIYWQDAAHQFQPIAGWMTPRYVAKSWQVPPEVVSGALGLEMSGGAGRASLEQVAEARGEDVAAVIESLDAAIAAHRATRP